MFGWVRSKLLGALYRELRRDVHALRVDVHRLAEDKGASREKVEQIGKWVRTLDANKEELRWCHRSLKAADEIVNELSTKGLEGQVGRKRIKGYKDCRGKVAIKDL